MSAPSQNVSQASMVTAYLVPQGNNKEPKCDTPIPVNKLSDDTLDILTETRDRLETIDIQPRQKRKRIEPESLSNQQHLDRERYPAETKPI